MEPTESIIEKDAQPEEDPLAELERMLIHRYLTDKGYRICDLARMPAADLKKVMIDACNYASSKLAEIEAKVEFREHIRYK